MMKKNLRKKIAPKIKLPSIKSLENKVWELCKQITRLTYEHKCVSCCKDIEGKNLHCGHYFRKKFIPLRFKYDLRILRPQCLFCNTRLHGNLEWYTYYLLKEGVVDIPEIGEQIKNEKQLTRSLPEQREFLENLIKYYSFRLDNIKSSGSI